MDPKFEAIEADSGSSLRCLHFTCADLGQDHNWHYHPQFELTWVIRSAGMRFVGDSIEDYGPDDLVLVGPNLPHRWRNDFVEGEGAEIVVLQFARDWLDSHLLDLPEAQSVREMLDEAEGTGLRFGAGIAAKASNQLRALPASTGMDRLVRFLDVLNILAGAADRVSLAHPEYHLRNDLNLTSLQRIERIHRYVQENLDGDITQAEIAARLCLSAPAFSRFFRAATGSTFVGFVNRVRINQACRLLASTNLPVTAIALECGYENISNFNRQFLTHKGVNPTAFRLKAQRAAPPGPVC